MDSQTTELLTRIANALERAYPPSQETLGFCEPPVRRKIFINQIPEPDETYLWYFWDGVKEQKIPIPQVALTGKIVAIEVNDSQEFKGQQVQKLHLSIDADHPYKIVTGLNTFTARSLILNTYCAYGLGLLQSPIMITLRRGEGTTFSTFYHGGNSLSVSWDSDCDLISLIQQIAASLK
jgi:hypothetical protein